MPYRKKGTPKEESERLNGLALKVALSRGGSVETKFVESKMSNLKFVCSKEHVFTKSIRAVVNRGGWCDFCRQDIPTNQKEAFLKLSESNWILLSNFESVGNDIKVRCQLCNIEREGPFRYYEGKSCHHKKRSNLTPLLRVEQIVITLGGKILSSDISNLDSKVEFECFERHRFHLQARSVVTRGTWCKECSSSGVTSKKLHKLIYDRGGVMLSKIPTRLTVSTKVLIRCSLGHEFTNDWQHMSSPRYAWCSTCTKGNKSEEIARITFKQIFGGNFRKARPVWLKNSRGHQMELDGYEEKLKLAFEYQGRQHFENIGLYSSEIKLKQRIQDDQEKVRLCAENNITLVQLRWDVVYEDFPTIIYECLKASRPELILGADFSSTINLDNAFIKDDRLEELRNVLKLRNLKLISRKWISVSYKYQIMCNKCKYEFKQQARSYLNSRKVAGCKKCAMKQIAEVVRQRKLGFKRLLEIAELNSGQCLSTDYETVKTKYDWVCSNGHKFSRSLDSMQSKGSFCTPCARRVPVSDDLRAFAESHGGTLVSSDYVNSTFDYIWRCALGHEFVRAWVGMRASKNFCPKCSK